MFKKIKKFFYNMVCDTSGNVNSKIFLGLLAFIISSVALFVPSVTEGKLTIYLVYGGALLGLSCFDNKVMLNLTDTKTTTETTTTTNTKDTKIDAAAIVDKVEKIVKRKKDDKLIEDKLVNDA